MMNKDRFLKKIEVVKNFITDTPKDYKNMDERFKNIHWTVKATGLLIQTSLITSCFEQKAPVDASELYCIPKNNGNESTKTDNERARKTLDSFLLKHPEYKNRDADPAVINFTVSGINANTIAFPSTPEEKTEINKGEYKIEGVTVTPYSDAIVWTLQTNPDCSEEWVKLAGVQYLNPDDSINTVWYSPEGLNANGEIDYKKVIAFNSKAPEYTFYPLVIPPHAIPWNDDITVKKLGEPWDGIQPFVLPISLIPDGPAKNGLLSLVPVEKPVSEEFNLLQEQVGKTKTHTVIPNQPWEVTIDGTIVKMENIIPKPDGSVEITYEGQVYVIEPGSVTVDGEIITYKNENGKTWVLNGVTLSEEVKEVRKFVPAETIEFTETLSGYELELAKDADLKAIYWDIAVSHLGDIISKSKGMESNRTVYEEIIKVYPKWEGIGSGSDYKERVEFMKEFLTRTGGLMMVQNHNFEKFEADFNQPIVFETIEVSKLETTYIRSLINAKENSGGGGGLMYVNENKQITYRVAIVPGSLEHATQTDLQSIYKSWEWTAGEVVSNIFRITIAQTAYKDRGSDQHMYKLYTKGGVLNSGTFYRDVYWTFIP